MTKKRWFGIAATVMAMLIGVTGAVPVLAADAPELATEARPALKALGIKAPRVAHVGKEVTIGVFDRRAQQPVAGAGVWAIPKEGVELLKEEISLLRGSDVAANAEVDYEPLVSARGLFLGKTDDGGRLSYAFTHAGRYLLVAVKRGYFPGFSAIGVIAPPKALGIKAPRVAPVGEEVTIGVYDRQAEEPVAGAAVWALTAGAAEALKAEMTAAVTAAADVDYESIVSLHGELLGTTDEEGRLTHTFEVGGRYLLVALKPGYFPGLARIFIGAPPKALGIKAPRVTQVGEEVTISVFDRWAQEPVAGAGVWGLPSGMAEALKGEIQALRQDSDVATDVEIDYESLLNARGAFIGRTDENGRVTHTFGEEGRYLLVAVKRGYFPGFRLIGVRPARHGLGIKAPRIARIGEEVTIGVFDRQTHETVPGAGVWALPSRAAESLKAEIQTLRQDSDITPRVEIDYESLLNARGTFIGRTDEEGLVRHTFEEGGGYLLVALKPGHFPGFARIFIGTPPKALGIRAPRAVKVGEDVTMTVFERPTGGAVEGAGLWLIPRGNTGALKEGLSHLREMASTAAAEADYESLLTGHGWFLGRTGENGELTHTFNEAGRYWLVAIKGGYIPGVAPINVLGIASPSGVKLQEKGASLLTSVRPVRPASTDRVD